MRLALFIGLLILGGLIVAASVYSMSRNLHIHQVSYGHQVSRVHRHANSGAINGHVLDMAGQPISGAEVLAFNTEAQMGKVPMAYTDEQGMFLINQLAPGSYTISVSKKEDGYPSTDLQFYNAGFIKAPEVVVYEQQTTSDVNLTVGKKVGKIVGRIVNATTRNTVAVEDLKITLRRVGNPNYSYSTGPDVNGNVEILGLDVPFMIEVSAPGYETKQLDTLQLRPEEVKRLDIALRPVK